MRAYETCEGSGMKWINALFDALVMHAPEYAPSKREVEKLSACVRVPLPVRPVHG